MVPDHRRGQGIFVRIALPAQGVQRRASGIGQAQHPADLVKGLAGGIVPGGAHHRHVGVVRHIQDDRVPAGGHQGGHGRLQLRKGHVIGGHMAPDVVHRHKGHVQGQGGGLCEIGPHQQRADKARGAGGGHRVQVGQADARLLYRLLRHQRHLFDVLAGGDLRHHAAVKGVHIRLGIDHVGQDLPAVPGDGAGRLVTGAFDG